MVYFATIFIVANAVLDFSYKKIVMKNSKLNVRDRAYLQKKGNIKTLILGDSHSASAVNTKILGNASLNFSSSGENYLLNYSKLRVLLEEDASNKIETILVPYELHSVSSFRNNRITDNSYWVDYVNYWEELFKQKRWSFFSSWFKGKFFSYAGEADNIAHYFRSKGVFKLKEGLNYRTRNLSKMENAKALAEKRANVHFKDANVPDEFAIGHLQEIYKLAKEKNKKLILVAYPIPAIYLEEANKIIEVTEVKKAMEAKRRSLFPEIPYFDFQNIFLNKSELFDDQDHLNFRGAEVFTKQLLDSLNSRDLL